MKVKTWMDGILKKTTSAMGNGKSEKIFDQCDMTLEDDPHEQGWVSILATLPAGTRWKSCFLICR